MGQAVSARPDRVRGLSATRQQNTGGSGFIGVTDAFSILKGSAVS